MISLFKKAIPLTKWVFSGGFAVCVDILILYILVETVHVYYLFAAIIAFLTSATVNYTISTFAIFRNAQHSKKRSYITFMTISLGGLAALTLGMFILVDLFNVHYLVSRIFLAGTLGVSSFFLHKYFSFKDVGEPLPNEASD